MKKLLVIGLLASSVLLSACGNNNASADVDVVKTTALAECLSESGWRMYGTQTCPHCRSQKALFGKGFDEIDYIDCQFDAQKCTVAGITGVPVWRGPTEGEELRGTQQLAALAATAGCEWAPDDVAVAE